MADLQVTQDENPSEVEAVSGDVAVAGTPKSEIVISALESAKTVFAEFIARHPYSSIDEGAKDAKGAPTVVIRKPWGDDSVVFNVRNFSSMADILNNVLLPERYSAIYHTDTKDLEVIWTASPVHHALTGVAARSFLFRYEDKEYKCEFGRASDRLLALAESSSSIGQTQTSWRNLPSFSAYVLKKKGIDLPVTVDEPLSFWVRGIAWNDDWILKFVTNLNFYMTYFDDISPQILIHSPPAPQWQQPVRFKDGVFPAHINARQLDDNLLHFWSACRHGDAARRFLYCYRIIEYAAVTYLEADVRKSVRHLLTSPSALSDVQGLTDEIVAKVLPAMQNTEQKFDNFVTDVVRPDVIWREIEQNIGAFVTAVQFEGGFTLPGLAKAGWKSENFGRSEVHAFAISARKIRNALSHGRDLKTSAVIAPTTANFELLEPWVAAMSAAAGEVIIRKDFI